MMDDDCAPVPVMLLLANLALKIIQFQNLQTESLPISPKVKPMLVPGLNQLK